VNFPPHPCCCYFRHNIPTPVPCWNKFAKRESTKCSVRPLPPPCSLKFFCVVPPTANPLFPWGPPQVPRRFGPGDRGANLVPIPLVPPPLPRAMALFPNIRPCLDTSLVNGRFPASFLFFLDMGCGGSISPPSPLTFFSTLCFSGYCRSGTFTLFPPGTLPARQFTATFPTRVFLLAFRSKKKLAGSFPFHFSVDCPPAWTSSRAQGPSPRSYLLFLPGP